MDVFARAVELIPGSAGLIAEVGGWPELLPELEICLTEPDGQVTTSDYPYLVQAALDLERMPYRAGGAADIDWLISELLDGVYEQRAMEFYRKPAWYSNEACTQPEGSETTEDKPPF